MPETGDPRHSSSFKPGKTAFSQPTCDVQPSTTGLPHLPRPFPLTKEARLPMPHFSMACIKLPKYRKPVIVCFFILFEQRSCQCFRDSRQADLSCVSAWRSGCIGWPHFWSMCRALRAVGFGAGAGTTAGGFFPKMKAGPDGVDRPDRSFTPRPTVC